MFKAMLCTHNEENYPFETVEDFKTEKEAREWVADELAAHPKMYAHIFKSVKGEFRHLGVLQGNVTGSECCDFCWNDYYGDDGECPFCHDKWRDN